MPRGTSAVDYRAHNPTDGGSIPSPATKHGFIMIEIIFALSVKSGAPAPDISTVVGETISLVKYDEMQAGFKRLISENVILNCCIFKSNENNQLFLSHFATTPENAQLFASMFTETAVFWEPYDINWEMSQQEIDFDTVDPATMIMIIDDNDILYELKTPPVRTISSPSRALANQS
jgi:hypothetical protein